MGGTLTVASDLGSGSRFRLELPLKPGVENEAERPAPAGAALVVSPTGGVRRGMKLLLRDCGYTPSEITGMDDLISRIHGGEPPAFDLVLVDEVMVGRCGSLLADWKRSRAELQDAQWILLVSEGSPSSGDAPSSGEYVGTLSKPVRRESFERLLDGLAEGGGDLEEPETTVGASECTRVLLAEDNPVNQKLTTRVLEKLGCVVIAAEDGARAVALFESAHPDIVFMDVQMPRVDGYEATVRIRALESSGRGRVPIIAMTANAMEGDRERCLEAGMDDYVAKPTRIGDLESVLGRWLSKSDLQAVPAEDPIHDSEPAAGFDFERLHEVSGGCAELEAELLRKFLSQTPEEIGRFVAAVESGDREQIAFAAHKLKGGCETLGARRLGRIVRAYESKEEDTASPDKAGLGERLDGEWQRIREQVEAHLRRNAA